jgi:hypothetical protein
MSRSLFLLLITAAAALAQTAADFSGSWRLNAARSEIGKLPSPPDLYLTIEQSAGSVTVKATMKDGAAPDVTLYPLDGRTETSPSRSTKVKWEGSAMLANIIVSGGGGGQYTLMERWARLADGNTLRIRRTLVNSSGESESTLVYELPSAAGALAPAPPQALVTRNGVPVSAQSFVVTSGTRILLSLQNIVDTKHAKPGDRVYLSTSTPIFVNERLVIPTGSYVIGTVSESKRAGRVKGRSELNVRFESITLPNGVTRGFNSRVGSAGDAGDVDREEGRIKGDSNKGGDTKTVATTTATGAGIGTLAGATTGHLGAGLGIGSAAGAAAGLAGVLLSRGPDVVLRPGTSVEMVIDRDLRFTPEELSRAKQQ